MAKRKNMFFDFQEKTVNPERTIAEEYGEPVQTVFQNNEGTFEVISKEDSKNRKLGDIDSNRLNLNQQDIVRGANIERYLQEESKLMKRFFFDSFEDHSCTMQVEEDNGAWSVYFENFPLPDDLNTGATKIAYEPDKENILILLDGYPFHPPHGIFIRRDSKNRPKIESALQGHMYSKVIGAEQVSSTDVDLLNSKGWDWFCFHYEDNRWNFNTETLEHGDCLAKYIENLYAAFEGAYRNV